MFTVWNDDMATGNDDIDAQHRDLLRKVNDLLVACRLCRGEEEIGRLIWFLKRYVRKHFRDEEKLQLACGFPRYQLHKARHEAFSRDVRQLEASFLRDGVNTVLIVRSVQMMCVWLRDHFERFDREMVEFVRNTRAEE